MNEPYENVTGDESQTPNVDLACTQQDIYGTPVRVYKKRHSQDLTPAETQALVPVQAVEDDVYQLTDYEQFVVASGLYHMATFISLGQPRLSLPTVKVPAYFVDAGRRAYLWNKEDRIEYLNYVEYLIKHLAHTNFARAMWIIWVGWTAHMISNPRISSQLHYMISRNQSNFVGKLYGAPLHMHWSHWMNAQHYHRFPLHQTVKMLPTTMGLQYVFKGNGLLHLQRVFLSQQASWDVGTAKNQSIHASRRRYWAMLFPHMHELFSARTVAKKARLLRRRQVSWRVKRYAVRQSHTRRAHHWHTCFHFVDVLPQRLDGLFQLAPEIKSQMRVRKGFYRRMEKRLKRGRRLRGMAKRKWTWLKLWAHMYTSSLYAPQGYAFRYYPQLKVVRNASLGGASLVLPREKTDLGGKTALGQRSQGFHSALARTFAPYSLRRKWHYRVHNQVNMYGNLIKYIGSSTERPAEQNMRAWFTFPDQYWAAENLKVKQEVHPIVLNAGTRGKDAPDSEDHVWWTKFHPQLQSMNPNFMLDPDNASRKISSPNLSERTADKAAKPRSKGSFNRQQKVEKWFLDTHPRMYHRSHKYETSANRMIIAWCWDLYGHTPHNLRHMKGQFGSISENGRPQPNRRTLNTKDAYGVDRIKDTYIPAFGPGNGPSQAMKLKGRYNLRYNTHHRFKMGVKWDSETRYALFDTLQRRIFMELQNNLPPIERYQPLPETGHDEESLGRMGLEKQPGHMDKEALGLHAMLNYTFMPYINTDWWDVSKLKTMPMRTANWVLSRPNRQPVYAVASRHRPGLYGPQWTRGSQSDDLHTGQRLKRMKPGGLRAGQRPSGLRAGQRPHKVLQRMRARQRLVLGQSDMLKRHSTANMWPNMPHEKSRNVFRPGWENPYTARSWAGKNLHLLLRTSGDHLYQNYQLMRRGDSLYNGFELIKQMNWGRPATPKSFYSGVIGDEEDLVHDYYDSSDYIHKDYVRDWRYSDAHEADPGEKRTTRFSRTKFEHRSRHKDYGYRNTARPGPMAAYRYEHGPYYMLPGDNVGARFSGFDRSWDPGQWGGSTRTAFNIDYAPMEAYETHDLYGYGPAYWFPDASAKPKDAGEHEVSPGVYVAPKSMPRDFQFEPWEDILLVTQEREFPDLYVAQGRVDNLIAPWRHALRKSSVWADPKAHVAGNRFWGRHSRVFNAYHHERRLYKIIMWTFVFVCARMLHVYGHRRRFTLWRIFNEFILRCRYFAFDSMFSMHRTVRPIPNFGMEKWVDTARLWPTLRYTILYLHEERKKRINRLLDIRLAPFYDPPNLFQNAPRGFMVIGPPGTGKTLLVKAFAGEARVPILVYGTEYYFPFYDLGFYEDDDETVDYYFEDGQLESERHLRNLFHAARHFSPCVVFIDEIDGVATSRDLKEKPPILKGFYGDRGFATDRVLEPNRAFGTWTTRGDHARRLNAIDRTPWEVTNITMRNHGLLRNHGGVMTRQYPSSRLSYDNKPRDRGLIYNNDLTLIRLLNELDGILTSHETRDFVVFGATNRPWMLDKALLRPGRLNTVLYLDLPSEQKRFELLQLFVGKQHVESIDWNRFSKRTIGFEPASLDAMVNFSRLRSLLLCKQQGKRLKVNHTNQTLEHGRNTQSYNISTLDVREYLPYLERQLSPPQPHALAAHKNTAHASEARFEAETMTLVLEKQVSPSVLTSAYASGKVVVITPEACPDTVVPEPNLSARAESLMLCRWALQKKHHVPQGYGSVLQRKMELYVEDVERAGFKPLWTGLIYGWMSVETQAASLDETYRDYTPGLKGLMPPKQVEIWNLALRAAERFQSDVDPVWSILLEPTVFGADRRFGYGLKRLFYSVGPHVTPSRLAVLKPLPTFYYVQDVCGPVANGKKGTPWNAGLGNGFQRANWHQLQAYGKEAFFARSAYYNAARVLVRYFLPKRHGYPDYDLYETCRSAHLTSDPEKWIFGLYQTCSSQADFEYMLLDLLSGKVGEQFFYFKRCTQVNDIHEHKTSLGLEHTRQVNWLIEIMLEHNLFYDAKHDLKRKTYIEQYDPYRGPKVRLDYPELPDEDIPGRELAAAKFEWFPKDTESAMYVHGNRTYIPFHYDSLVSVTYQATQDFMGEIQSYDDYGADQWFTQRHHIFHMKAYETEKRFPHIQFEWQRVGLNHNIDVDLSTLESWHILNVPCENQMTWNAHWNRLPKAEQDLQRAGALRHAYEKLTKVLDENQLLLDYLSRVFLRFQSVDEKYLFKLIHQWLKPRLSELTILPDSEMEEIRYMYSELCQENPTQPPVGQDVYDLWQETNPMPTGADVSGPGASTGADVSGPDASIGADVSGPDTSTGADVSGPDTSTGADVSGPDASTGADVSSPDASTDTDVSKPDSFE